MAMLDLGELNRYDGDFLIRFPIKPYTFKRGRVRLLSLEAFEKALDPGKLNILKLIAFGISKPPVIGQKLKMPKSTLYKYVGILTKYGWIEKDNDGLIFSAPIYLVYEVKSTKQGHLTIEVINNKGAFIDERTGFIMINGTRPIVNCTKCPMLRHCTQLVKTLADKFGVNLSSKTPAEAYIEILANITSSNLAKMLSSIFLDVELGA